MPIRAVEYSLFKPGKLVTSRVDIHSTTPIDGDAAEDNPSHIRPGTVGIILQLPTAERKYEYQVQFLNNIVWWVHHREIEPFIDDHL